MQLKQVIAHLDCSDLQRSEAWYAQLFERAPDRRPMAGLVEWHLDESAGLQLFEDAQRAGGGTLTLIVEALAALRQRLTKAHLAPGPLSTGDVGQLCMLSDPDGNRVALVEPR
ncbi:VOC family protein [Pseudohoeflea coraliihabitans]|uniref:VOC family protein n=1 Tax=Pseudohoeflea coraliihabitans TaxID=2860393 RepID=A0ABS6WIV4_9HYPH|nr:VOC family protein [Pseudohoeflea sp. DP4N28-3]MBW3095867.1 VOC family protein [Pseudohoeflea sp. DP4N28-3]